MLVAPAIAATTPKKTAAAATSTFVEGDLHHSDLLLLLPRRGRPLLGCFSKTRREVALVERSSAINGRRCTVIASGAHPPPPASRFRRVGCSVVMFRRASSTRGEVSRRQETAAGTRTCSVRSGIDSPCPSGPGLEERCGTGRPDGSDTSCTSQTEAAACATSTRRSMRAASCERACSATRVERVEHAAEPERAGARVGATRRVVTHNDDTRSLR